MAVVIITSDTHGLEKELKMIKERHQDEASAFIHCGDSELDFDSEPMKGFEKVRGNCDFDPKYPEENQVTVEGVPFFITHGHLFQVKMNLMPLSYRADEVGAKIVCFGHSHLAGAEKVGEKLFINPGSVRQPRGGVAGRTPTYVRLAFEGKQELQVEFVNMDGEVESTTSVHID
ncbi:metallophosphoesterase [Salinibacillus xinjiangensis]|uniref:Phosphoesterase n=1 Tax=Salinibacillus xinjiangensis TaxID=1229268 RepID=A0A6G1XBW6_9BACI|nr:metallophosphoesterase [Salinibacillus xinjiangensis]MRG88370.1 YfcE family phosphodiesterase [Salinibacillus xinjiangensis]